MTQQVDILQILMEKTQFLAKFKLPVQLAQHQSQLDELYRNFGKTAKSIESKFPHYTGAKSR